MSAVLQMLGVAIVLAAAMTASAMAQDAAPDLVAPIINASDMDGSTALPTQLSRALSLPFEQVCEALAQGGTAEPDAAISPSTCSVTAGKIFAQARSIDGDLNSIRFKLNSSAATLAADLPQFATRVDTMANGLGLPVSARLTAAIAAGTDLSCMAGPVQFQFWRERGDVPRYNLVMRIVMVNAQSFSINPQICAEY